MATAAAAPGSVLASRYIAPYTAQGAPPGYVPSDLWLQNLTIAIEVIMPSISLVVCALRLYSRTLTKNIGWDDYCLGVSMILSIAQGVSAVIYIKVAYIAIHYYEIPPHDLLAAGIWGTVTSLIYNPILSMVKVSVLAFLLRFASIQTGVRITIWVLIVFTLGLMVAATLGIVFMCTPIAFNWDPSIKIGSCIDKPRFVLSTSGLGVFTDITTIAIPFYIFLGLRMTRKKKMAILAVFGLGAVVTGVSIIRLVWFARVYYTPRGPDSNYSASYVLSTIENNLAIVAASGPALWPLARRWLPRLFSRLGLSRGYQGHLPDIETTTDDFSKDRSATRDTELQNVSSSPRLRFWFGWKRAGGSGGLNKTTTGRRMGANDGHDLTTYTSHTGGGRSLPAAGASTSTGQTVSSADRCPRESGDETSTRHAGAGSGDLGRKPSTAGERPLSSDAARLID